MDQPKNKQTRNNPSTQMKQSTSPQSAQPAVSLSVSLSFGLESIETQLSVCVMCVPKIYYVFMEKVVAIFHTLVVGEKIFRCE